jgi:hypothetical protein
MLSSLSIHSSRLEQGSLRLLVQSSRVINVRDGLLDVNVAAIFLGSVTHLCKKADRGKTRKVWGIRERQLWQGKETKAEQDVINRGNVSTL